MSQCADALGASWFVFGAQAAILWGRPRHTADLDVTIRMEPEDPQALKRTFEAHGFELRVADTGGFVERSRVLPFTFVETGEILDVVIGGPGLDDQFVARAVRIDVEGCAVPFISPEDLIVTKVLAARAKDMDDVVGVLKERSSLDVDYVRATLRLLQDALGQSDLLPAFEQSLQRAGRTKKEGA